MYLSGSGIKYFGVFTGRNIFINQMIQLQTVNSIAYYPVEVYRNVIDTVFCLVIIYALLSYDGEKASA